MAAAFQDVFGTSPVNFSNPTSPNPFFSSRSSASFDEPAVSDYSLTTTTTTTTASSASFRSADQSPSPSAPPAFVDWRISSSHPQHLRFDLAAAAAATAAMVPPPPGLTSSTGNLRSSLISIDNPRKRLSGTLEAATADAGTRPSRGVLGRSRSAVAILHARSVLGGDMPTAISSSTAAAAAAAGAGPPPSLFGNFVTPVAKKSRSRTSSLTIGVDEMNAIDDDDFDDVGSESSFGSVGSAGLAALSLDAVRRNSGDFLTARRPSDSGLGNAAAAAAMASASQQQNLLLALLPAAQLAAEAVTAGETLPLFEIPVQPKEKQRKSYKNENRYLTPNPLSIKYKGGGGVPRAVVEVMLADEACRPLEAARQAELVGERQRALGNDGLASFSLKMHDTSRNEWIRLLFVISFADGSPRQWICTSRFRVDTNVKRS